MNKDNDFFLSFFKSESYKYYIRYERLIKRYLKSRISEPIFIKSHDNKCLILQKKEDDKNAACFYELDLDDPIFDKFYGKKKDEKLNEILIKDEDANYIVFD